MENPNEQSQSYIINLLVRYGSLNSIYNEVIEIEKLTMSQQQKIFNFYKDFKAVELFETELLCFCLSDNQTKNQNIVNQLKSRIKTSVSLYDENSLFINKVNVYEVCYYSVVDSYKSIIKLMSDSVGEYRNTRRVLNRELDPPFEEPLSKQNEAGIRIEIKRLEALEVKAQEELDVIYREKNTELNEILKYKKNVFKDIQELGLCFITIINNYFSDEKEISISSENLTNISDEFEKYAEDKMEKVEEDTIFMKGKYDKFLDLEDKLIEDRYLNTKKKWIAIHRNKIQDKNSLVTFLVGLMENNYFLPNKDPEIKVFIENRYQIDLRESFQEKRRKDSIDTYKIKFIGYHF